MRKILFIVLVGCSLSFGNVYCQPQMELETTTTSSQSYISLQEVEEITQSFKIESKFLESRIAGKSQKVYLHLMHWKKNNYQLQQTDEKDLFGNVLKSELKFINSDGDELRLFRIGNMFRSERTYSETKQWLNKFL